MGFPTAASTTTDPKLVLASIERYKKLIVQNLIKSWFMSMVMIRSRQFRVNGAAMELPFYPDGPASTGSWISYNDPLPEFKDSAQLLGYVTNRYLAIPMGWNLLEEAEAQGDPSVLIPKMTVRSMEASWAHRRAMSQGLWNGTGGKMPDGLTTVIQKAAPASQTGTHLGISRTTSWWKNKYVQLTSDFGDIAAGTSIPAGILALMNLISETTVGTHGPDLLITTKDIIANIRRAAQEAGTWMLSMTKREDVKFGILTVDVDGVPCGWDPECPADSVYSLHLKDNGPKDAGRVNNTDKDKSEYGELDDVEGTSSILDLDGSMAFVSHPKIQGMKVDARSATRSLGATSWLLHSGNLMFTRLSDHGVAGSDTGARWSTW